jgi:carbamoyl-phosphate synthase large subunit
MNILITGVGGGGIGEQLLKCLRLSDQKYRIIGTDVTQISAGLQNVDKAYVIPPASDPTYLETILQICRDNDVKALFHGSEPELKIMSANRKIIQNENIFLPINTEFVINTCLDKFLTNEFLNANGFNFPKTKKITTMADANDVDFFPIVLKPSVGGGGSANTMIAQNKQELQAFCQFLLGIYPEFIIQEYIGTPDSEYTACVLNSMEGEYINTIAIKRFISNGLGNRMKVKNTTNKTELGESLVISSGISQGQIGRFEEVTDQCKTLASAIKSQGPINIQLRLVNGKMYVFEINPRYSGTSCMRAMVGFNEPDLLIRKHLLHQNIPSNFEYKGGYMMRSLAEQFIPKN